MGRRAAAQSDVRVRTRRPSHTPSTYLPNGRPTDRPLALTVLSTAKRRLDIFDGRTDGWTELELAAAAAAGGKKRTDGRRRWRRKRAVHNFNSAKGPLFKLCPRLASLALSLPFDRQTDGRTGSSQSPVLPARLSVSLSHTHPPKKRKSGVFQTLLTDFDFMPSMPFNYYITYTTSIGEM